MSQLLTSTGGHKSPWRTTVGEQTDIPVLSSLLQMPWTENHPTVDKRVTGNLLEQCPNTYKRADNLLRTATGQEDDKIRNLSRLSSTLGGPSMYNAESVEKSSDWQERQRLVDLIKLLQDKGIEIPTTREIKKRRYR